MKKEWLVVLSSLSILLMYSHRILGQGAVDGYLKGKGNLDIATSFSGNSAERFLGSSGNVYDLKYKGSLLSLLRNWVCLIILIWLR